MRLKPFRQGGLDGLCGVYSVINATRLAAWPTLRLAREPCNDLFSLLTADLNDRAKLFKVLTNGSRDFVVRRLLREADSWLRDCYGIRLRHRRPYPGRSFSRSRIAAILRRHLAEDHTSAIIGLSGCFEHWSVVRAVKPKTIMLFDSSGMKRLPVAPAYSSQKTIEVLAENLFLIRCEVARGPGRPPVSPR
jgi:hypothetical protein